MFVIVTGGSRSGKSALAEQIAQQLCSGEKVYLATMLPCDSECEARIALHVQKRAGKGYRTVEQSTHLEQLELEGSTCVLLECMSTLVANEMYDVSGIKGDVVNHIIEGILGIQRQSEHLIVVTNEVFSDQEYDSETMRYLDQIGRINQRLVKEADVFIEAVYGIAVLQKGKDILSASRIII